jgi:hypothetical protein
VTGFISRTMSNRDFSKHTRQLLNCCEPGEANIVDDCELELIGNKYRVVPMAVVK